MKASARTTSRVVTPKRREGLKVPAHGEGRQRYTPLQGIRRFVTTGCQLLRDVQASNHVPVLRCRRLSHAALVAAKRADCLCSIESSTVTTARKSGNCHAGAIQDGLHCAPAHTVVGHALLTVVLVLCRLPARLNTSAAIGTVELTGLLMIATHASGHAAAIPSHRVATMPALMLNRSSRVMPGLRGTPANKCDGVL